MSIELSHGPEGDVCRVTGDLDFTSVAALPTVLPGDGALAVQLEAVGRVDSAGLALLLEWVREASTRGRVIRFHEMPAQLLAIAQASGVDTILPRA